MPGTSHGDLCKLKFILLQLKTASGKNCEDIKIHFMLITFFWK